VVVVVAPVHVVDDAVVELVGGVALDAGGRGVDVGSVVAVHGDEAAATADEGESGREGPGEDARTVRRG
jgi:fructose-1-phosphate kinase PfkB-like protein